MTYSNKIISFRADNSFRKFWDGLENSVFICLFKKEFVDVTKETFRHVYNQSVHFSEQLKLFLKVLDLLVRQVWSRRVVYLVGIIFEIHYTGIRNVCPKTSCLDGKIQFRGVLKKMIVRFTGVNERLFFLTQRRKWSFRQNTT